MARLSWLFLIALSLTACKRKPQDDPATTKPSDAKPLPDRGTAEVLPAQKVTPVGAPLGVDPATAAGAPAIEVDGSGAPVVAWIEGGMVQVRRWDGSAWQPLGEAVNQETKQAQGVPVLAREDQGLLLGWIETVGKLDGIQVARWKDGAWTVLGAPPALAAPAPTPPLDLALAWSNVGPVVVWRQASLTTGNIEVHAAALGAQGWARLGAPLGTGTANGAPALATRAGGPVVVGWIEKSPAPTMQLRRWNPTTSTWDTLPPPPGADAHGTLSMAATSDGALHAALSYTVGLRQLASFVPGAMEWTKIGVPESANGQVLGQRVTAGDDGRLIFTYPFGGRYAYWDGRRWSPTSVGVKSPSTVVPAAAGAADGKVYVAWSDSAPGSKEPDRVRVFLVE